MAQEKTLWESANKLRGSVESSEYKHIVLGLIFLKFVSDTFEERRERLLKEGKEAFIKWWIFALWKMYFTFHKSQDNHTLNSKPQTR